MPTISSHVFIKYGKVPVLPSYSGIISISSLISGGILGIMLSVTGCTTGAVVIVVCYNYNKIFRNQNDINSKRF